ncbi:MAG: 6,7-dimethyl-8-ribityllumazine synthase [Ferruginibacter sp.]
MALSSAQLYNLQGIRLPADAFVIIVRTEWNSDIVDLLETGCLKVLNDQNVKSKILTVPGVFEIGFAIKNYWDHQKEKDNKPLAFIALGCVLKGDTPHFEYVCNAVTDSINQLNLLLPVPSIYGILTVNNRSQADERTGGAHGNKGEEAAITALKMIELSQSFK